VIFGRCTCTNCTDVFLWSHVKFGLPRRSKTSWYWWPCVDLRRLACWDCGLESRRRHGCFSLVSVLCWRRAVHSSRGVLPTVVCRSVITKPEQLGGQGLLWLSSHKKVRPTRAEAEAQLLQNIQNSFVVISAMSGVFRRGQPVTDLSCGGLRPSRRCSLCTCQFCS
jgi:hypothetical protein